MAADITIVAAGIVAAAQPGLASEAVTSPYLTAPPAPEALEQAEMLSVVPAKPLPLENPRLELPPIASAPVPDFSAFHHSGDAGRPSIESLTAVETLETQLINQQLGQTAITLSGASPVNLGPMATSHPSPPLSAETPLEISIHQNSTYEQLTAVETEIVVASVGKAWTSQVENGAIALQPPAGIAPDSAPPSVTATAPAPRRSSALNQFDRDLQKRAQALDRFEAQLLRNPVQNPVSTEATATPSTEIATAFPPRAISRERQILAQVMMDSAEAQFLESSGLGNPSTAEAFPRLNAQGSGPAVEDDIGQVTRVSQLRDVQPTDWAYQATQSLVERYGCTAGYPDSSFRGNRALSRYEFAAGLNACLDRVTELLPIAGAEGGLAAREDLAVVQQLAEQFQAELEQVRNSVTSLEQRQADLEAQQFSTTTKLYGQTIFGLRGSNNNDVDLFPVDGDPERSGAGEVTLGGSTELTLATSFRGNDLLLTTLQAGNIAPSASTQFTNMGRLAYENDTDNQLVLSDLSYRFAATPSLGVIVGSHGVNPTNTFRGISPLEGSGDGAISRLGQRNPILELGSGRGGAGFDWQVARNVSVQGIYSATSPNQAGNNVGLFNGGYVAGGQVSAGLGRSADLGIHYLHSYSPSGSLGTGIGDAQVISPFATEASSFRTHAVGATAAWRPTRHLTVGGWGGWTSSTPTSLSGNVQTTNWMGFAQVNDLFQRGNSLGLLFGQPSKITSSNLPVGFNFPEFSDGGGRGGRRDTALHLEAFYRAQLNDHISVTPGIVVVRNPNHNADNDTLVVGAMRTTFRF